MTKKKTESREIEAKEKQEVETEGTRPGLVFRPDVDILEREDAFVIHADLPGIDEKSLDVRLDKGMLTLEAHPSQPPAPTEAEAQPLHQEYQTGGYYRQFRVSDKIDGGGVTGKMKDGVLELVLPKTPEHQARRIEVNAG